MQHTPCNFSILTKTSCTTSSVQLLFPVASCLPVTGHPFIKTSWNTLPATIHSCCTLLPGGDYSSFFSRGLASYKLGCPSCFNIPTDKLGCPSCFNIPTTPLKKNLNNSVPGGARIFRVCSGALTINLCGHRFTRTSCNTLLATSQS